MPGTVSAQLADVYVHTVERALREYEAARRSLATAEEAGSRAHYREAQDAIEGTINALHRAACTLERLRRLGFAREDGTPFVPRQRDTEVLSAATTNRVRAFRDAIEHVVDDISSGRLDARAVPLIHLSRTRARMLDQEIAYVDLGRWIRSHYQFARFLSAMGSDSVSLEEAEYADDDA